MERYNKAKEDHCLDLNATSEAKVLFFAPVSASLCARLQVHLFIDRWFPSTLDE